jgi:hypothetical protein
VDRLHTGYYTFAIFFGCKKSSNTYRGVTPYVRRTDFGGGRTPVVRRVSPTFITLDKERVGVMNFLFRVYKNEYPDAYFSTTLFWDYDDNDGCENQ